MKALLLAAIVLLPSVATADSYVSGYVRRDGTYVQPHMRSEPNNIKFDNYSSQGNFNPYTGQQGYRQNEFSTPQPYPLNNNRLNGGLYDNYGDQ
jgi:hypothetical protein